MKTVLITGGSRGIGAATARAFAAEGYRVAVNYLHSREKAETLAEEIGGIAVRADVGVEADVRSMVDSVLDKFCQLDILVCNAGVAWQGLLTDMSLADWRSVMAADLDGVFLCCRAVLPHFIHRKAGKIVTVSSMWGQVGASCEVGYSATKGAVIALTRALAKELGPSGIRVNCVAPGVILTDMCGEVAPEILSAMAEEAPLQRNGTPADVAQAIVTLVDSPFVTGQVLGVNGGYVM